ncbi:MAG: ATP-binding protein [Verrucomicrobiota bacterium]
MSLPSEDIEPVKHEPHTERTLEQTITLGKLSRGIAHDINNLVTSIHGNAQLAERGIDNTKEVRRSLCNIKLAARHITDLTAQIQAFSRTNQLPTRNFDLTKIVREIEVLIGSTLSPNVELEAKIEDRQLVVHGTPSQLSQAVMNLCTNALQAIGAHDNGRLGVSLESDEENARLVIEDNGHGIEADKLDHIFDPFFTTKHFGLGSGLGLAVVKGVIDAHQGRIHVYSDPGEYTRFLIELPLSDAEPIFEEQPSVEGYAAVNTDRNRTVLLVDDEPTIRGLGVDILHSLGYRVTVACDGKEALEIFNRRPEYFDIILSDSRMPEMTGLELAAEVRKVRPEMPFILITAFDDTRDNPILADLSITNILPKPFRIEQLQTCLRQASIGLH